MDSFACSVMDLVTLMSDSTRKDWLTNQPNSSEDMFDCLADDEDLLMEQILDNMNSTPIGKVLKTIASLPDNRRQKVLRVRKQLTEGRYDLNEHLDVALEKVLNDLNV
ncbi:MAG: hypothetical protein ABII09_01290 [Planctomycetota bacterium]